MISRTQRKQRNCRGYVLPFLCFLYSCVFSSSSFSQVQWSIQAPIAGSTIPGNDVFISVSVNKEYHLKPGQAQVFLDNKPVVGNLKLTNNQLYCLLREPLPGGKHDVRVEAYVEELKEPMRTEWSFFTENAAATATQDTQAPGTPAVGLKGMVQWDNRSEFLSGPGQGLRQEPNYTSTVSVDGSLTYRNVEIPVRIFATSNNSLTRQTMNFYQVGFRNRWLSVDAGDINPNFDRLILTGVRVRGLKLMARYKAHSLQLCYGQLNQAREGSLLSYEPGTGVLPTNLVTDSQYVAPGVYKRTMGALRLETGNRREIFKIGLTAFKAKDDTGSINYGLAPKENVATGLDLGLNLFRKRLSIQSGAAVSVVTNDISNGVIDKSTLDTAYNIRIDFDPAAYKDIITLNASTVPTSLENADFLSWYSQLNFVNKYQRFSLEYRKVGSLFTSLGNPFQRLNYEGIFASERFFLLKKKMTVGLVYQNYSNNLNGALPAKISTHAWRGNIFLNIHPKWPSVYLNYTNQSRTGKSAVASLPATNDQLSSYLVNIGLDRTFWKMRHYFFAMANINQRVDKARNTNSFSAFTGTLGLNESITDNLTVSAEAGKMLVSDDIKTRVSDINIYSASVHWHIKPDRYFTSVSLSNNSTLIPTRSYRPSAVGRFSYRFWRGMELLAEGGYQPFRDQEISSNNYNDAYVYIRYSCDLWKLTSAL